MKQLLIIFLSVIALSAPAQKNCDLERMFFSIAEVESGNDSRKVNGDCVGILQIRPIMVKEANRLSGFEAFFDNDRYDVQGSFAIFSVIMRHKNPQHDLRKACQIWNPTAGEWYYQRVRKIYLRQCSAKEQ